MWTVLYFYSNFCKDDTYMGHCDDGRDEEWTTDVCLDQFFLTHPPQIFIIIFKLVVFIPTWNLKWFIWHLAAPLKNLNFLNKRQKPLL